MMFCGGGWKRGFRVQGRGYRKRFFDADFFLGTGYWFLTKPYTLNPVP